MAITSDTHVQLGASKPKTDATIATGVLTLGADEVAIKVGSSVSVANTQQIIGDLEKLYRYAKTNIGSAATTTTFSIPLGGSDYDIVTTGHAVGLVSLYVHADIMNGNKSHFLHRTFKRCIELLLEDAK